MRSNSSAGSSSPAQETRQRFGRSTPHDGELVAVDSNVRRPPRAEEAVAVLQPRAKRVRLDLARLVPSSRSTAIALILAALALALYLLARDSSLFAVRRIERLGAPP